MISLDFEKAYDSLEWNFMIESLKKFNFGINFIKWVEILYNNPCMVFKNNGWLSSPVYPTRGIRQGCPISCLLFILSTEIMACAIRQDHNIKGIIIGQNEYKLSQYADDSNLFLRDVKSIDKSINLINKFTKVSGLKLNLNKTDGIWLGNYKDHPPDYNRIRFTNQPIRCLGIYVGHNKVLCDDYNWKPRIEKLRKLLNSWKERELTMFGKVLIIKCLGISSMIFNFMLLDVDECKTKEINKLLYNFVWNTKERIQRSTLIGSLDAGGISMVDVESKVKAIKAGWLKHLVVESKWSGVIKTMLHDIGLNIDMILKCNFTSEKAFPCIAYLPVFYQQVFINFNKCKSRTAVQDRDDVFSELLWGNEVLKYKGKCMYEKNWIESGILYVKDLIHEGKLMKEEHILSKLKSKRNWISEFVKVKKVVSKLLDNIDIKRATFINIKLVTHIVYVNERFVDIKDITNKEMYRILVRQKIQRPKMEHVWCKEFKLEKYKTTWNGIYTSKVIRMPIPKLKEFNYKLLNNTVICGKTVSIWNKDVSDVCEVCTEPNTVRHMLFECERVKTIWQALGRKISCDITWKHIVIGFVGTSDLCSCYNIIISIIAYNIYAQWIKSINHKITFKEIDLYRCCVHALSYNNECLKYTSYKRLSMIIKKIIQQL